MASQHDIQQAIQNINDKWDNPPARNGCFRNILKSVSIRNVRQLSIDIEFTWPITVIGGVNGSGKSSILQFCSAAYSKEKGGRYYKIGDWVRAALPGETPAIGENARVKYGFWDETPSYEVPHTPARRRWKYPKNAPQRNVEFIGITSFAPRIEKRDRTHVFRSRLEITGTTELDVRIVQSIGRILGQPYDSGHINTVGSPTAKWTDTIPQIERAGAVYTEPHMGAGEQKIVRLVQTLEAISANSLIILEEPEITLHPDAQRGLAWYLMTLSVRKGHQIVIATHSTDIFDTLPKEARVLLVRIGGKVEALHSVASLRAARELSGVAHANKALILVEDNVAKCFLEAILRKYDKSLFDNTCVVPVGNTDDVARMVLAFRDSGAKAVGVRDPDIGQNEACGLLSLPGDKNPEALLLADENIDCAEEFLSGVRDAYGRARPVGLGLTGSKWAKKVLSALPAELSATSEMVVDRLTLVWLSHNEKMARSVVAGIKKSLDM